MQASECLPTETVPMTSTLPWKIKIQYLLALQVSRYCPLVLQSCTVALFLSLSIVYAGVMALLVEKDNIHASHLDGPERCQPGRCRHPKFEVVLYRGVGVFQVIRGLKS